MEFDSMIYWDLLVSPSVNHSDRRLDLRSSSRIWKDIATGKASIPSDDAKTREEGTDQHDASHWLSNG